MITLDEGCDPLRAGFPFNGADPSYVESGFLSPKGRAGGENRTPISSLEGWSNSLYTTPAFNSLLIWKAESKKLVRNDQFQSSYNLPWENNSRCVLTNVIQSPYGLSFFN